MQNRRIGKVVGIVFGAFILLLSGIFITSNLGYSLVTKDYQFETEGLTGVFINSNNSTLNIYATDLVTDIQVTIKGRKSDVKNTAVENNGGTLAVTGSNRQSRNVYITILVPKNSAYNYEASVLSGSVTINALQGKEFVILSNNGDIAFSDIQAESINITANNGIVNIENTHNGNHYVKSDSGTVIVTNSTGETLLIENNNGTIRGSKLEYNKITPISDNGSVDIQ